ncbi:hypothetical protein [Vibrio fluvialis]|uniref:hypothetical protein n=1 Tax=Vibrio fluvialis TaxID=676 RepID=UPI00301BEC67
MDSASELRERVKTMRRSAMAAALRNINLHVFKSKASAKQLNEYVANRLAVEPIEVRLWLIGEGVPEGHVAGLLAVLNENSVWARHQLLPSERLAKVYEEDLYA